MITRIKISRSATGILAQRYKGIRQMLTPNIILRNALMFSISKNDIYDDSDINTGGTEFQVSTLFGEYFEVYFMLLNEFYKKRLNNDMQKKVISFHIEQGLTHKEFIEIF
jgi:DNA sulfur modification protein DndE